MATAAAFVINNGVAIITNLVSGIGGTIPKWIGWGTGATTAVKADTGLQTAGAEARTVGTPARTTVTNTNDNYQVTGTITSLSAQTIQEVALFDALTVGNCFLHATHGSQVLAIGDGIAYTINVQFQN